MAPYTSGEIGPPRRPTGGGSPRALLVVATLFWAGDIVVGRATLAVVPPIALVFWTWVVAFLVVLPFGLGGLRDKTKTLLDRWRWIATLAMLGVAVSPAFFYMGLGLTTAINASLIVAVGPATVPAVAWLIGRTRLGRAQALGFALAFAGVVAVVTAGDPTIVASLGVNPGDILVVIAMFSWSFYSVLLPRRDLGLRPAAFLTAVIAIGTIALVPVAIWEAVRGPGFVLDAKVAAAMLYIGIFPAVLAFLFWNRAVAELGPTAASAYLNLTPVFSIGLAWALLSEPLYAYHGIGIALILAGVHLATRRTAPP